MSAPDLKAMALDAIDRELVRVEARKIALETARDKLLGKSSPEKGMSPEARQRISEAQKARWARQKALRHRLSAPRELTPNDRRKRNEPR